MLKLYVKMLKRYGFIHVIKNIFEYAEAFRNIRLMAEKFSVTNELEAFKKSKKLGMNFTHMNILMINRQIKNQEGVNFQKKIRFLTKVK